MHNELTIGQFGYNNQNSNPNKTTNKLKNIGNDSLVYFGLFLSAFFLLQFVPFASGFFEEMNIGVNEVVVSLIGFANVFFFQVFNKIFSSSKCS